MYPWQVIWMRTNAVGTVIIIARKRIAATITVQCIDTVAVVVVQLDGGKIDAKDEEFKQRKA